MNGEINQGIERVLAEEGYYVSTTVGISMKPMLRNRRDRVIIRAVGDETLKPYDLPLYRYPEGKYVLHRILEVREDCYVIRGDNTYVKEYIPKEWILGYVTEFYRGKKLISTDSRAYRTYARVWQGIYPLRLPFHKLRVLAGRVWRKTFGKNRKRREF